MAGALKINEHGERLARLEAHMEQIAASIASIAQLDKARAETEARHALEQARVNAKVDAELQSIRRLVLGGKHSGAREGELQSRSKLWLALASAITGTGGALASWCLAH